MRWHRGAVEDVFSGDEEILDPWLALVAVALQTSAIGCRPSRTGILSGRSAINFIAVGPDAIAIVVYRRIPVPVDSPRRPARSICPGSVLPSPSVVALTALAAASAATVVTHLMSGVDRNSASAAHRLATKAIANSAPRT